jgi:hypothetical protein
MPALRVLLGFVSVSASEPAGIARNPWRRLGRLLGVLGSQHLPQPVIGLQAGCNGLIALLPGLLAADALDRHCLLSRWRA